MTALAKKQRQLPACYFQRRPLVSENIQVRNTVDIPGIKVGRIRVHQIHVGRIRGYDGEMIEANGECDIPFISENNY